MSVSLCAVWKSTSADGARRAVQQRRPPLVDVQMRLMKLSRRRRGPLRRPCSSIWEQREALHERAGEEAASGAGGGAAGGGVDLHAKEAATRRVLREDVAVQPQARQLLDATRRPRAHRRSVWSVSERAPRMRSRTAALVDEAHRLTRRPHPHLGLRADGRPLDVRRERLRQERVAEVPTVVAQRLAEQAGADADTRLGEGRAHTSMVLRPLTIRTEGERGTPTGAPRLGRPVPSGSVCYAPTASPGVRTASSISRP